MSTQPKVDMSVVREIKTEPNGRCFHTLGADGVVRVVHLDTWEVIDGAGLSPIQLKEWLERYPFDQAKEDKFRGVDGRGVSKEGILNPPHGILPQRPSPEFFKKHQEDFEEQKRKGFKRDPNAPPCNAKRSTYNLDPI